jgi:DNA-binding CsgD family transcriptional regulator
LSTSEEEQQILAALHDHMPWNEIARRFKVSSKTIARIAKSRKSQADAKSAVEVFKLLSRGVRPEKIVIGLGIHPNLVGELLEQFEILKEYDPARCDRCFEDGYRAGCEDCTLRFPCMYCGKDMIYDLSREEDRKTITGILQQGGISRWYHTKCEPASSDATKAT